MAHGGKREDMLEFGMPTLIELPEPEDCARLCNELGLRFVELNMCLPQYQIDRIDPEQLISVADKYGIYYTIHLDETISPATSTRGSPRPALTLSMTRYCCQSGLG